MEPLNLPKEEYVIVKFSDMEEIKAMLKEIKYLIQEKAVEDANSMWLDSETARKMLAVSPRTWQTIRDNRIIPFSQYGRKLYVRRADIEAFLMAHRVTAKTE